MITLRTVSQSGAGTFGVLLNGDAHLCFTCEQPWADNAPDVSCIPAGVYQCVPHDSPRFPDVWEVTGVPGRSAILIHNGNFVTDTHGCILVGDSFDRRPDSSIYGVAHSVATLEKLRNILPDTFTLTIER